MAITTYLETKEEDIFEWCVNNGQREWLVAKLKETKTYPVYPKKAVQKQKKKDKQPVLDENGNPVYYTAYVQDKKAEPIGERTEEIGFAELKLDFFTKFFPERAPKKGNKKPSKREELMAKYGL